MLDVTPISRKEFSIRDAYARITDAPKGAVVLERIARGGGATNWFVCESVEDLDQARLRFRPGSCVTFYFDMQLDAAQYTTEVYNEILDIVHKTGEAVVGIIAVDGLSLNVEFISGVGELNDFVETLGSHTTVYYGTFPGHDNDGVRGITVELPDADGVVRAHPH